MFLQEVLDRKDVFPGGILVSQTFGGMANWNPHVHALITDFRPIQNVGLNAKTFTS